MTKIRCGIRENAKYLGGKQNSTDTREAGFITIWAGVSGFSPRLSGIQDVVRSSGKCETTMRTFTSVS